MKLIIGELDNLIKSYEEPITLTDGLEHSQKQVIKTIEFMTNSRYETGDKDEAGRDKPYFNVVNANVKVTKTGEDLDTKDIQVTADEGQDWDKSFVLTKDVYRWMKDTGFGVTLNDMIETKVRYGGVLVKKTEDEELKIEVVPWKNVYTDQVDILKGAIIEKHWMSPVELTKKMDAWDEQGIKELIKLSAKKKKGWESKGGVNTVMQIPVYEIHGEFTEAQFKDANDESYDEEDQWVYHNYVFIIGGEPGQKQFILWKDTEDEKPYKYHAHEKRSGRGLGVGVVEEGFEAQVWTNDSIIKEQSALELGSKIVLQSASKKLKGRNVLTEVENGVILEHEDNKPITSVVLTPSALAEFQNMIEKWKGQYERVTATYDSQRGETPPSGQAFRLQALIQQQSNSTFEQRREEFGLFITEIFNDWVLPYLAKKLNKAHILASDYTAEELKRLDNNYATFRANEMAKEKILAGQLVTQEEYDAYKQVVTDNIKQTKNHRFLDIPKDYYKNIKAKVTVITTGEQRNKMAVMETLSNLLTVYLTNPAAVQSDPVASQIFGRIMEISGGGLSPFSLGLGEKPQNGAAMPQTAQSTTPAPIAPVAPQNPDLNSPVA